LRQKQKINLILILQVYSVLPIGCQSAHAEGIAVLIFEEVQLRLICMQS